MSRQPDLFDDPFTRSRLGDPETSREAAASVSHKMTALRRIVLGHFALHLRMTDFDLETLCGDHGSTYRTRRSELVAMGYLKDSEDRKMQAGTNRIVWEITPNGIEAARTGLVA